MGFFWTIVTLVVALGLTWRYPRLLHGGRLRRPGPLPRLGRAAHLPAARDEPGAGADLEALRRVARHLLAVSIGFTYLILRIQGSLPLNPQHLGAVGPALSFNTAVFVRDQHELAELRRRDDDVVLLPDRRADRPAVREPRRRHRGRDRDGARLRPAQLADDRQLLGRHHPLHALHPAAHRLRRRDHLRRPGCGADPRRHRSAPRRAERCHPDDRPRARSASWRPSSSSAPTAAASSTPTPRRRSRTRPASPTGSRSTCCCRIPFALTYTFGKMVGSVRHGARPAGGDGAPLRRVGRLHQLRRAPGQPGRRGSRASHSARSATPRAKRSASATPRPRSSASPRRSTSTGSADALVRLVHPDRRLRAPHRHDARRGHARAAPGAACTRSSSTPSSPSSSAD